MKILLVEDDITLAMGIEYSLKNEEFTVMCADSLKSARDKLKDEKFDIVLLDVSLPDGNGYDLCKEIRNKDKDIAIIFLTACDEEVNIVMGLDMGGDDYLTKPIRVKELIARINAVIRRKGHSEEHKNRIEYRDLVVCPLKYEVYKSDEKILLTSAEYKLLLLLLENRGNVLTRKQLLEKLWDVEGDFIEEKTLTVYIKRLREKLLEDKKSPYIETVRGVGYRWI